MIVLLPGPVVDEDEGRTRVSEEEVEEEVEGMASLADLRLPMLVGLALAGGAAIFFGSNLDRFPSDLTLEVEGLFLLGCEDITVVRQGTEDILCVSNHE